MNNKLISVVIIIVLFVGIFTVFITVANAKGLNLFCSKDPKIMATLKNDAKIDAAKEKILQIPRVKIISIKDRDKEWSKMVNKMDLPNMQNPFKNEFIIKTNRNADVNEIYEKIKEMDFVEKVEYISDDACKKE